MSQLFVLQIAMEYLTLLNEVITKTCLFSAKIAESTSATNAVHPLVTALDVLTVILTIRKGITSAMELPNRRPWITSREQ